MKKQDWERSVKKNGATNGNRRLSRRRSDLRREQVYGVSSDQTIRAVTPESATEITALPSPSSFMAQGSGRFQIQSNTASVSNTEDEESGADHRKVKKKHKHRDATQADTSPNNFFEKTRNRIRLGSVTTSSAPSSRQEDAPLSIGYPSVVQATVFPEMRDMARQLPRTPRRTFSSDTATTAAVSSLRSPLILESDSEKILKLMKTVCGRMHGILFYRPIGSTSWHSGYCAINVAPGSLVCQTRGVVTQQETLIPDLRGCTVRTHYDSATQSTHLSVVLPVSGFGYELRPSVPETFDSWLAALLCWQPLKPKGIHNKMAKPQSISMTDKSPAGHRRLSDMASPRSTAVVKSSQMLVWDGALPAGSFRHQAKRIKIGPYEQKSWRRVNCTLHENGTLRMLAEDNPATPIRALRLNNLNRCAIQRLDESVLGAPYCIAIHPQYTIGAIRTSSNPLVLALNTRVAFEAWFVLLLAMTVPELYGPEADIAVRNQPTQEAPSPVSRHMFRIERSLQVKIIEAKFQEDLRHQDPQLSQYWKPLPSPGGADGNDIYADVLLGRDLRARTVNKKLSNAVFWAEDFRVSELPSVLPRVSIVIKRGNPDEREWTMQTKSEYGASGEDHATDFEAIEIASHDPVYGRVDVQLQELEQAKTVEKWWPLSDSNGTTVGQMLIKFALDEHIVLLESEYAQVSRLLHNFDNSLTSQLGHVLGTELKYLSDILLDIFQASGKAEEWINNLVEEDIDGIYREQPPSLRMRYSGRIHSNDSYESAEQRELLVRDLSRSATLEANLLFRGNSLVTKALDAHMRRLGRDYLERTLGEKLRTIVATNPSCEVDPNKIPSNESLERNWSNLIGHTTAIWQAIASSVQSCPPGIRHVLKHIGSCAEDRYGSFIRTVKYTSVSGFLFLRLFCPCILNPKLFGLLEDHPPEKPRRTLTLVAKGLMNLANLAKFGQKEPWMEPMNKFLTAATPGFKSFIDEICSWSPIHGPPHEPQHQAALQIKQRLPPLSREGLPSLPFLLDGPRSIATLVDLWVDHAPSNILETPIEESVKNFHKACLSLQQKTTECMANAELAQEPSSTQERQWQKMLNEQPRNQLSQNPFDEIYSDTDITALPQPADRPRYTPQQISGRSVGGSKAESPSEAPFRATSMTNSTNSSNVSFDNYDDYRNRANIGSRDGAGRGRFLDISNHNRRARMDQSPAADLNRF